MNWDKDRHKIVWKLQGNKLQILANILWIKNSHFFKLKKMDFEG